MYMVLIQMAAAIGLAAALGLTRVCGWGWASAWGVIFFLVAQGVAGYLIRKRVKAAMESVQKILMDGQQEIKTKLGFLRAKMMSKPGSQDPQAIQAEVQNELKKFVLQTLEGTKQLERFNHWVPLMSRQIASLRVQLYWMIKDFKKVDELMPIALITDPMMAVIKMARMYMLNQFDGMEKLYLKATLRLPYGQGALVYALYSWILVQRKQYDAAYKVLIKGTSKMENPILQANREALANNRVTAFSNAGMGDEWYALHLEQPKMKTYRPSHFQQRGRYF